MSPEQENAIDLLILVKPDREVADAVGVTREAVLHWRNEHPVFLAELNRWRQALWAEAHERLWALIGKAVDVLDGAVGDSNVKAAINALKAVKLYGEMSVPQGPTAPDVIVRQHAAAKLDRERVPRNNLDRLVTELNSANYQARLADVEAEVRTLYFDP